MKIPGGLFILIAVCYSLPVAAQLSPVQQEAIVLQRQIQLNHYSPKPIDDSLSAATFSLFIKQMDAQQDIFLADEYQLLAAYKFLLDDELNKGNWKFLDLATSLYRKGLKRADSLTKEILNKPIDYTADEQIIFSKEPLPFFARDIKELKQKWIRWFRFIMLNKTADLVAEDSTKPSFKAVLEKNEKQFREKISKGQVKQFKDMLEDDSFEAIVKGMYFNAIARAFDPHTSFFSPQEKEEFQSQLSTEEYSYGFDINETKEGKIVIDLLIPGGPAWKTGEVHKDDEIIQIQRKGKPAVDVSSLSIEEAVDLLSTSNHEEVTIKLKKKNGTIKTVILRKEKIEVEEDVVKGFLLSGEKKVGYIALPDFYTQWEDEKGSGCANDMAKEIIKMKRENLDGLILDLRYNGGGSLNEALQLCGIFIDEGPMFGVKEKDGKLVFGKDPNRGTIYDGPLVILVNNQSASASELVAGTLQDYQRAVIAGSATYGKATMQAIFPMDSSSKTKKDSPNGFVKITTGKLYRLTGETAQSKGVIPDILLPDAFDGLEYTEKYSPYVLPSDTARKNNYFKQLPPLPIAALSTASIERVKTDPDFQYLSQYTTMRNKALSGGKTVIPLKPEAFEKWRKEKEALLKMMDEKELTENKVFTTGNYKMETERLQNNAYATTINKAAIENIQTDIQVREAYNIITDLIKLHKK